MLLRILKLFLNDLSYPSNKGYDFYFKLHFLPNMRMCQSLFKIAKIVHEKLYLTKTSEVRVTYGVRHTVLMLTLKVSDLPQLSEPRGSQ